MIKQPVAPCEGCEDRYILCHADCEKYKNYRAEQDKYRKEFNRRKHNDLLNMNATWWDDKRRKAILKK